MIVGVERCPQGRSHAAERNRLIRPDVPARRGGAIRAASAVLSGTCRWLKRDSGHSAPKADPRQDVQPLEGRLPLALKVSQGRDQRLARRPAIRDWVSILKAFRRFLQNLDGISSWTADTAPRGRRRTSESRPSICSAGSPPPKASASTIDPRTRSGGILRPPGSQLGRSLSCPAPSHSAPRAGTGATHDAARAQPQACTAVQGNQAKRPDGLALDS